MPVTPTFSSSVRTTQKTLLRMWRQISSAIWSSTQAVRRSSSLIRASLHPPGENVLIAWDGSREAARAVADAQPLLESARYVSVDIVQHADGTREAPIGIDVAAWLDTHGATTRTHIGADVGTSLLDRASDMQADLIVMGAYGHSRARERVFGGVTRAMLESMTLPVLMSH